MFENASPSLGLILKVGNGASPEVFTAIAEVKDFTWNGIKLNTTEVTHYTDTWEAFKATTRNGGQLQLKCNFVPTDTTQRFVTSGIGYDLTQGTLRNFQVDWPDTGSTVWALSGFVTDIALAAPLKGVLEDSITIKVSGAPTFA